MTPEDLQSRPPGPLAGIKVVELASWMFVPSAGTVLVDWGADVVKVEHPVTGDPQRGLVTSGLLPGGDSGINFMMEQPNRGKRSVAIDIAKPDGHEAFMRLIEGADVFLTNYLPQVRRKLRVDVEDVRARNPQVVVARGSGQGARGPDAEKGGYDAASFWARGGVAAVMPTNAEGWPAGQPSAAFGTSWAVSRPPVPSPRRCSSESAPARPPSWTYRCSPPPCGSFRQWWWRPGCSG
jgi:crotonobetainyl-CoA:carnitine CoA-transferase CaiB-like acyl-CoA transferase